jgi:cytochrome o ubiquinol oxidase subunit 1
VWGHPEVYILILPAFGVFSEIIATFSGKPLFGYRTMVWATCAITLLSFLVWLHHFFTMGSGADVNAFFGITTMIIAIPTGVKIFNWLFTMYRGRIRFTVPVLWTLGFMVTFTSGGMTGVMLAIPGADFVLHNSLFLIAHFHNVIIGGVLFGYFAGYNYWFPKMFGFKLDETWGKRAFWLWLVGFYIAFMPLYVLGFLGMTRRLNHYSNPAWHPWLLLAEVGAILIAGGIACQLIQIAVSIRDRNKLENLDPTGDPWDGRTLEWATSSPPPFYNFAVTPQVHELDAFADMKEHGYGLTPPAHYADIHMPRNTCVGLLIAIFSAILGFGLIWHIWWLAAISAVAVLVTVILRTFDNDIDYILPASEVARIEGQRAPAMVLETAN